jgi:hypothetical protein
VTQVPTNDLPDYLDGGIGLPVFRGPFLQHDVQLAAFLYQADGDVLAKLCDQTLNRVSSAPYRYIPLLSKVMVVYADMLVSSMDRRDRRVGSFPETEVGFWVLTVAMQKTPVGEVPHHLAWFIPQLFVDEGNSIATGREVYGFNKQAADFVKPQDIQSPQFSADVLGIQFFSPTAIAQKERLFDLSSSDVDRPKAIWNDWRSMQDFFIEEIARNIRPNLGGSIMNLASQAFTKQIRLVFLKQTRSASDPHKASSQTIIEAPLQIKNFYGGSVLTQTYTLRIFNLNSHPLAQQLGLESEQSTSLGAWMKVDFILGLGTET